MRPYRIQSNGTGTGGYLQICSSMCCELTLLPCIEGKSLLSSVDDAGRFGRGKARAGARPGRTNTVIMRGCESPGPAVPIVATIVQAEQTPGRETDVSDDASRQMQVMMEEAMAAGSEQDGWSPWAKLGLLLACMSRALIRATSALQDRALSLVPADHKHQTLLRGRLSAQGEAC